MMIPLSGMRSVRKGSQPESYVIPLWYCIRGIVTDCWSWKMVHLQTKHAGMDTLLCNVLIWIAHHLHICPARNSRRHSSCQGNVARPQTKAWYLVNKLLMLSEDAYIVPSQNDHQKEKSSWGAYSRQYVDYIVFCGNGIMVWPCVM